MAVVSHYDIQPVIDIFGSVQGRDLGGVADEIDKILKDSRKELPKGSELNVRGQVRTMRSSYTGLLSGLAFAILLVYLLIVVNFQSWLDPSSSRRRMEFSELGLRESLLGRAQTATGP